MFHRCPQDLPNDTLHIASSTWHSLYMDLQHGTSSFVLALGHRYNRAMVHPCSRSLICWSAPERIPRFIGLVRLRLPGHAKYRKRTCSIT